MGHGVHIDDRGAMAKCHRSNFPMAAGVAREGRTPRTHPLRWTWTSGCSMGLELLTSTWGLPMELSTWMGFGQWGWGLLRDLIQVVLKWVPEEATYPDREAVQGLGAQVHCGS